MVINTKIKKNPFDEAQKANPFDVAEQGEIVPIRRPEGTRGVFDNPNKQLDALLGDDNLDDFMPFDAKYDFGRIIKMTESPGETEDKVKLSMLYKSIADVDPQISFNLMDELNKIVVGEPSTPTKTWGRVKDRYKTGKVQVQLSDLSFEILKDTWKDWEKFDENIQNIQKLQSGISIDQRKEFRSWWEKMLGATAEQLPNMWEAVKEQPEGAIAGGLLFALTAAVISAASPTIGEEAFIPAAGAKGAMWGAGIKGAMRIGQLEAGNMFLELAEMEDQFGNRLDPRIAVVGSMAVGSVNGAIELGEWMVLLKTFGITGELFKKSVSKVTRKLVAEGTLKELLLRKSIQGGIAVGAETLQEIEQETSAVVFGELAKEINNARKGTDFKPITAEELKARYTEVTLESARAFGLLVLPGTTVSGVVELATRKPATTKAGETKPAEGTTAEIEVDKQAQEVAEMDTELAEIQKGAMAEAAGGAVEGVTALEKEAKKYDTADEFIESVPIKTRAEKRQTIKEWKEKTGYKPKDSSFDRGDSIHSPSGPEDGAPLYDLADNGIYPEDVYSMNGRRYYGTGEEAMDAKAYSIISDAEGLPNKRVKIYRAVEKGDPQKILPGDWVTTVRPYAKEHGAGTLKGEYKIVSKSVRANEIFTSGDSWLEYGYHPQAINAIPRKVYTKYRPDLIKVWDKVHPETPQQQGVEAKQAKAKEQKAAKPIEKKISEKTDAELLDQRGTITAVDKARRTPQQIKTLNEIEDELVGRHPGEETDISKETRKKAIEDTENKIIEDDYYQTILEAQEQEEERIGVGGKVFVNEKYRGEAQEAIQNHPILQFYITYDSNKGAHWDAVVQEGLLRDSIEGEDTSGHMDIGEFLDRLGKGLEARKNVGKINITVLEDAVSDMPDGSSLELLAIKQEMLENGFHAEDINDKIKQFAIDNEYDADAFNEELLPVEGKQYVKSKRQVLQELQRTHKETQAKQETTERRQKWEAQKAIADKFVSEQQKEVKNLRRRIHATAAVKGLTKKALEGLKKKHAGYKTLTGKLASKKITTDQLKSLLEAVQKARPKQIGHERVITKKTEKKIQSLKESLKKDEKLSDEDYAEILQREVHGKEPKYTNAKNFITETEGKDIIGRMRDAAEVQGVVLPRQNAIAKNKAVSEAYKKIKPTGEIKDPSRLWSMRFYMQRLGYKAKVPIYDLYMSIIDINNQLQRKRDTIKEYIMNIPGYDGIVGNEASLKRISEYIASKSHQKNKPQSPVNITSQEVEIAKYLQKTLKQWEWKARLAKFLDVGTHYEDIPQHNQYKKQIRKAVDINDSQGVEALIEYLKTQEWGVVKSGYEPTENITLKIRPFVMPAKALPKGHIKPRTQIEYMPQERNILQRFDSYLRQIDNLSVLKPKINALIRLVEDNIGKFDNPQDVRDVVEVFLLNLKHVNPNGNGLAEKIIKRLYSQAITVRVLGDPLKVVRNYPTQNLVFEQDKSTLFDSRNKPLTAEDTSYFTTNIEQSNSLMREWAFIGEKPLIAKGATEFIKKHTWYPWSDKMNRMMSFSAKLNQVNRAIESAGKDIDKMMKGAKFSDYEKAEQQMALGIYALEGPDAMARYLARAHVENTHYLYDTKQRSPAEQTPTGKLMFNLFLFRRASLEKLFRNMSKAADETATTQQRLRAAKVVSVLLVSSFVTAWLWKKLTGQRTSPYDYRTYLEAMPGGLAWGAVEEAAETYNDILSAATGVSGALAGLSTSLPRTADMMLPFYKQALDAIEATTGTTNLDRLAIRKIREMIDHEYKVRGDAYEIDRKWYEAIQRAIAGSSVDAKIKENKKGSSDFGGIAD